MDDNNVILFPGADSDSGDVSSSTTGVERGSQLATIRDPARQVARQLYLGLRPRSPNPVAALERVLEALASHRNKLPVEAPPADRDLISGWAVEGDWEGRYRASLSIEIVDAPNSDARRYLSDLQYQCEMAREILQRTTNQLEGPPPLDHKPDQPWPTQSLLNRWDSAQRRWMGLQQEVTRAREGVVRADREGTRDDYWEAEYAQTLASLKSHYEGGGPQYDLLATRLASLDVRLRQMERSGRDISTDEYKTLHDLHLKYTAQLQKHTEATKSESIQPVQDAIKRIVSLLERRIKPVNPPLWGAVVEDIIAAVGEVGAA